MLQTAVSCARTDHINPCLHRVNKDLETTQAQLAVTQ